VNFKNLIFVFIAVNGLNSHSSSQTLPNGGIESWVLSPNPVYEEPQEWSTSNRFTSYLPEGPGIFKSNVSYSGVYAARITTLNIGFGAQPYAGFMVNGNAKINMGTGAIMYELAGTPLTAKPAKLTGYFHYQAVAGDSAHVFVTLRKYNPGTTNSDTVAIGSMRYASNSGYTLFDVPITDLMPSTTPDTVIVAMYSSYPVNPVSGGILMIDQLALDFTTSEMFISPSPKILINHSNGGKLTIQNIPDTDNHEVFISDITGRILQYVNTIAENGTIRVQTNIIKKGIYLLQIKNSNRFIYSGKFMHTEL
jgi:hypothetical protein